MKQLSAWDQLFAVSAPMHKQ